MRDAVLRAGCLVIVDSVMLETVVPTPPLFTCDTLGVEVLETVIWLPMLDVTEPSWTWLEMGDSVCMPLLLLWVNWSMSRWLVVWIWFSLLRCSRAAAPSLPLPANVSRGRVCLMYARENTVLVYRQSAIPTTGVSPSTPETG